MANVYPQSLFSSSSSPSSSSSSSSSPSSPSSKRENFTLWMKSLVMSGNGCTVYNSNGQLVYRVDNYDYKCSDEVYLMDQYGRILIKILRKKLRVFAQWEGYRCNDSTLGESKPWFRVRKASEHKVTVGCGSENPTCYKIVGCANKSEYKVMDMVGNLVAEIKRKHTARGVLLGNDVLTLVVEANVDQILIMGLVIVCGLINHTL